MFRQTISRLFILISLFMLTVPGIIEGNAQKESHEQSRLLSSSSEGISFIVQVPFHDLVIENEKQEIADFVRVSLPTMSKTSQPGTPELPTLTETIAIPFGVELEIQVTPGEAHTRKLDGDVVPVPYQSAEFPLPEAENNQVLSPTRIKEFIPDETIYSKNTNFPGRLGEISNIGIIRQQRIAGITLYPIQFNPVTSELTIFENLQVEVTFKGNILSKNRAALVDSSYYETIFSQTLLNYEGSHAWRMDTSEQIPAAQDEINLGERNSRALPWMPPDPAWKIKVSEDGFYQLTYDELLAAGLDVENLNPQTFQLFNLGSQVAIWVEGEADESFDPGDTLIFYGQTFNDKYTLDNMYWLTYGSETVPWLRMPSRDVTPEGSTQAQYFYSSQDKEIANSYWPGVPGGDDFERFLWDITCDYYTPNWWTNDFMLNTPYDGWDGSGYLDLALVGASYHNPTNFDHHAIVKLNNIIPPYNLYWDGFTWEELHEPIPPGYLVPGTNEIKVIIPGDTGSPRDCVFIDWFSITYAKAFIAEGDQLHFNYEITDDEQFHLTNFSTTYLALFDISDPQMVIRLLNFQTQGEVSPYSLTYQEDESISGLKNYWAAEVTTFKTIPIEQDFPSDLQSSSNQADHIIITHGEFIDPSSDLAEFRNGQGLQSVVVDVQDVYDEFGYGIVGTAPIRDFLAYAYENWQGLPPSFVVLVGDGHYNPKGYNPSNFGALRENYIPPYLSMVDPYIGETAADNRYVTFKGDDTMPDMMLGRLAVNSQDEAAAFINKIIAYEEASVEGDWKKQVLAIADKAGVAGNFPGLSQQVLSCCLPSPFLSKKVYLGITHPNDASARSAIIDHINNGVFLVNYFGHSYTPQWGLTLLATSDIPNLTNANQYPILAAMDCRDGYYINPHAVGSYPYESLAEAITKAENKGAVASWSPTGYSLASGHATLDQAFFNAVFSDFVSTIGQATTSAKLSLWASVLFGDPATNFQRDHYLYLPLIAK